MNTGCRDVQTPISSGFHSESSRPTPRRCWRSLGPPSRALGARLNNNTHGTFKPAQLPNLEHSSFFIANTQMMKLYELKGFSSRKRYRKGAAASGQLRRKMELLQEYGP